MKKIDQKQKVTQQLAANFEGYDYGCLLMYVVVLLDVLAVRLPLREGVEEVVEEELGSAENLGMTGPFHLQLSHTCVA